MIKFRSETLFAPRIFRRRIRAANIATDDPAGFVQLSERPLKIDNREPAGLPICHCLFDAQAIKIDCELEIFINEAFRESLKPIAPILAEYRAPSLPIFRWPIVCPRVHFKNSGAFSAAVPENLVRPPTFEISAAPNAHAAHMWKFQRAVDPATASPFRRTHIPVRMVVE